MAVLWRSASDKLMIPMPPAAGSAWPFLDLAAPKRTGRAPPGLLRIVSQLKLGKISNFESLSLRWAGYKTGTDMMAPSPFSV